MSTREKKHKVLSAKYTLYVEPKEIKFGYLNGTKGLVQTKPLKFKVVVIGDLKYLNIMAGKENMSGKWCLGVTGTRLENQERLRHGRGRRWKPIGLARRVGAARITTSVKGSGRSRLTCCLSMLRWRT